MLENQYGFRPGKINRALDIIAVFMDIFVTLYKRTANVTVRIATRA